jgi:hypothetical protein
MRVTSKKSLNLPNSCLGYVITGLELISVRLLEGII